MKNDKELLKNSIKTLKHKIYYLEHKEHYLIYMREYRKTHEIKIRQYTLFENRRRKYYRDTNTQAEMPVDLFMMRNKQRFNEGISLNYE